ncbi:formin-E-like [Coccinella septempunctata]|uniref:formin-E-like n=1 Tax=Coccinella septempunctata TaxID=41139 RepID=UPI001D081CF3|nr:formin-E-like [Coccinella septempunctata]
MSTLTRRSSGNRVPDYKDYMSFVSAYRNGKKEPDSNEDGTFILSGTGNMAPEVSGFSGKVCDSYSSFLEKTKNKKFSSVKPPSKVLGQTCNEHKQSVKVKTEIYLEINNINEPPKRLDSVQPDQSEETIALGQVEARKKMFEGRTQQQEVKLSPVNGHTEKTKITTIKQKLESSSSKTSEDNITPKLQINKLPSSNNPKYEVSEIRIHQEKPVLINQKTKTEDAENPLSFHVIEKRNNELQADVTSKEKLIGQLNEALRFKTSLALETEDKRDEVIEKICVVDAPKEFSSIPPPPPPMPNGFTPSMNSLPKKPNQESTSNRSPPFKSSNEEDQEHTQRSGVKNHKSSTLERTNPLVRKLAYGAMLDMYGAYHEKANSYVSTLPRQHVKKDNGLQKIIDSIAAQGGLDKLSGRSNPKAENE